MAIKPILITGGAGFIGSALARTLRASGPVRIYDDFHRPEARPPEGVEIVCGDILDTAKLQEAARGCEVIIHAAAIAGVHTVVSHPFRVLEVNLLGTANVVAVARTNPEITRLVFFSTSEVYGPLAYKSAEESVTAQGSLHEPRWVYGVSKLAGEHLIAGFGREYCIPWTIIRPFNVYGPGQLGDGAIHNFVRAALANEPLVVHGNGSQLRSWCYIDDCVRAVVSALRSNGANLVMNVGNPRATCTTLDLAQRTKRLTGSSSPIVLRPIQYPDIDVRIPNIEKAQVVLGWWPSVDLEDGLTKTIAAYRETACASS